MTKQHDGRCEFDTYYTGAGPGRLFRWLDWAKCRLTARTISRHMEGKGRLLDLGCGAAAISGRMASLFPELEVHGADSNAVLLEAAAKRGIETRQVDFDLPLPYDADTFDMVVMVDAIEHITCRKTTLEQVKRVLKPSGTFIVFTPPYDTFTWWLGERLFTMLTRRPADHITPFTRESLQWLLQSHFSEASVGRLNIGLTMWGIGRGRKA